MSYSCLIYYIFFMFSLSWRVENVTLGQVLRFFVANLNIFLGLLLPLWVITPSTKKVAFFIYQPGLVIYEIQQILQYHD